MGCRFLFQTDGFIRGQTELEMFCSLVHRTLGLLVVRFPGHLFAGRNSDKIAPMQGSRQVTLGSTKHRFVMTRVQLA